MFAIQAYLDDSGSDGQSPHYVLSGFMGCVPDWERFSTAWTAALNQDPKLEYFKASEAQSLKGQFDRSKGWTAELRDERIRSCVAAIKQHTAAKIDVVMPQVLYDKHVKGKVPKDIDSPYFMCLLAVVEIVVKPLHQASPDLNAKIDFIFDNQQKLWRLAENLYQGFKGSGLPYVYLIGEVDHRDDKEVLPLQAADLGAWHSRRRLANPGEMEGRECFHGLDKIRWVNYEITESDVIGYMAKFRNQFSYASQVAWSVLHRRAAIMSELVRILAH